MDTQSEAWKRREAAIDARYYELADDPDLLAQDQQIMKEFESIDSESARLIDEEFGPWDEGSTARARKE